MSRSIFVLVNLQIHFVAECPSLKGSLNVQKLKSRWHSPVYILVKNGPFTYLPFGIGKPSILTLRYLRQVTSLEGDVEEQWHAQHLGGDFSPCGNV